MPYNFKIAMSASLDKDVVEQMIRAAVEQQTGKKVASLDAQTNGGYIVHFENETPRALVKSTGNNGFKITTY